MDDLVRLIIRRREYQWSSSNQLYQYSQEIADVARAGGLDQGEGERLASIEERPTDFDVEKELKSLVDKIHQRRRYARSLNPVNEEIYQYDQEIAALALAGGFDLEEAQRVADDEWVDEDDEPVDWHV